MNHCRIYQIHSHKGWGWGAIFRLRTVSRDVRHQHGVFCFDPQACLPQSMSSSIICEERGQSSKSMSILNFKYTNKLGHTFILLHMRKKCFICGHRYTCLINRPIFDSAQISLSLITWRKMTLNLPTSVSDEEEYTSVSLLTGINNVLTYLKWLLNTGWIT